MTQTLGRRTALAAASAAIGLSATPAARAAAPVNGMIFCHTMGTAADLAAFKAATGIDFNVTCWSSNTDTITKLASGAGRTFDIFNLSRQFIPVAIQRNLVAPLDLSKIPNSQYIAPFFAKPAYSTVGDKQYSLPLMFGYDSMVYNRKKLGTLDSYAILFDEKYKGQISIKDDPGVMIPITALYMGYTNPWRLETADLKKITDFLIAKKPMYRKLWGGFAEAVSLLKSEEVVAVGDGWISMAWTLNDGGTGTDFAICNPKEKALVWTHDWLMPKEALERGNTDEIYAYMNWSIGPQQAANMGRKVGYVSPSVAGLQLLSPDEQKRIGYDDYKAVMESGMPMSEFPANYQEWVESWSRFKAA